ncbi:hypothetical protein MRX96_040694 [Rhipicephalus microplus]
MSDESAFQSGYDSTIEESNFGYSSAVQSTVADGHQTSDYKTDFPSKADYFKADSETDSRTTTLYHTDNCKPNYSRATTLYHTDNCKPNYSHATTHYHTDNCKPNYSHTTTHYPHGQLQAQLLPHHDPLPHGQLQAQLLKHQ